MQYLGAISKVTKWTLFFQGKPFNITVIQIYAPTSNAEAEVEWLYEDLQDLLEITPRKEVLFIIEDWNAKVGSQEITGTFGVQNEAGQRLIEFCQENTLVIANTLFQQHKEKTLHMDIFRWSILKSDLLYSLELKMGKLYAVSKKQDWELTMAQIMSSLLTNSDLNWKK